MEQERMIEEDVEDAMRKAVDVAAQFCPGIECWHFYKMEMFPRKTKRAHFLAGHWLSQCSGVSDKYDGRVPQCPF